MQEHRRRLRAAAPPVHQVTGHGTAERRQVHAQLVGAAGHRCKEHQRASIGQTAEQPVAGDRRPASRRHCETGPVAVVAADRQVHGAAGLRRAPVDHRQISLACAPPGELAGQRQMRVRRLCEDDDSRGLLVQPMDHARPHRLVREGVTQPVAVAEHAVQEGAGAVARPRVGHHAGRLVQDDSVAVLMEDRQLHLLRYRRQRLRVAVADGHAVARAQARRQLHGTAVDGDHVDACARLTARKQPQPGRQIAVQPRTGEALVPDDRLRRPHGIRRSAGATTRRSASMSAITTDNAAAPMTIPSISVSVSAGPPPIGPKGNGRTSGAKPRAT